MGCKICSKDIKVNVEIHVTNENIKDTEELEKNMLIPLQILQYEFGIRIYLAMLSKHILRVRPKHCTGKKKIEEPLPLFELIIPSIEIPPSVHLPCENPNNLISITEYNRTMGLQSLQELSPPTYRKSGINLKKSASLKQALLSFDSIGSITSLEEGKTEYRLQLPKRPSGKVHSKRLKIQICNFRQQKSGNVTNNYEILEQVGAGAFGVVKKVQHIHTKQIRAMKIIAKDKFAEEMDPKIEFEILKTLDHPNIMKLYEYYEDEENYYLIMEFCAGGELFKKVLKLNSFMEREAAYMIFQVISALSYCHDRKIVHRDIKPENLLLLNDNIDSNIKIIDFGASRMFIDNKPLNERFGTPFYIAPEVVKGNYNEKCDLWSTGVIAFILLSGAPPFTGKDNKQIMKNVLRGSYSFNTKEWRFVSRQAKQFVQNLLIYNPDKRLSAKEALNDPWIIKMTSDIGEIFPETAMSAFNKLSKFSANQRLQEAVLAFMVSTMQEKEEEGRLLEIFQAFDSDKDGQLSKEELIEGYTQLFGDSLLAVVEVDRIIEQVDISHNGLIDYSEFLMANASIKLLISDEKLKVAFDSFDLDGNGLITVQDLKDFLGTGNEGENDAYWEEILNEIVDKENAGEINFLEFKKMMQKLAAHDSPLSDGTYHLSPKITPSLASNFSRFANHINFKGLIPVDQ